MYNVCICAYLREEWHITVAVVHAHAFNMELLIEILSEDDRIVSVDLYIAIRYMYMYTHTHTHTQQLIVVLQNYSYYMQIKNAHLRLIMRPHAYKVLKAFIIQ